MRDNDYFDGPFDQVPPRLPIGKKLEAAYPYLKYRGGIDEHGNFLKLDGIRVAISPYAEYLDLAEFGRVIGARVNVVAETTNQPADRWLALTYDSKRDFHRRLELAGGAHVVYMSQGWPANHLGPTSYEWPDQHAADQSGSWAPNHEADASAKTPGR